MTGHSLHCILCIVSSYTLNITHWIFQYCIIYSVSYKFSFYPVFVKNNRSLRNCLKNWHGNLYFQFMAWKVNTTPLGNRVFMRLIYQAWNITKINKRCCFFMQNAAYDNGRHIIYTYHHGHKLQMYFKTSFAALYYRHCFLWTCIC